LLLFIPFLKFPIFVSSRRLQAELAQADEDADLGDIPDETAADIGDEVAFQEQQSELMETSLDQSAHQILHAIVDPVEWKMELERVGPRLRAQQQLTANEWRAHVDSTVQSKGLIEKVMAETQGDLQAMHKEIKFELDKLTNKETYPNSQFASLRKSFEDVSKICHISNSIRMLSFYLSDMYK
jgi:hypothetical protein